MLSDILQTTSILMCIVHLKVKYSLTSWLCVKPGATSLLYLDIKVPRPWWHNGSGTQKQTRQGKSGRLFYEVLTTQSFKSCNVCRRAYNVYNVSLYSFNFINVISIYSLIFALVGKLNIEIRYENVQHSLHCVSTLACFLMVTLISYTVYLQTSCDS